MLITVRVEVREKNIFSPDDIIRRLDRSFEDVDDAIRFFNTLTEPKVK